MRGSWDIVIVWGLLTLHNAFFVLAGKVSGLPEETYWFKVKMIAIPLGVALVFLCIAWLLHKKYGELTNKEVQQQVFIEAGEA